MRFNQCERNWHTWKYNLFNMPPLTNPPAGSALVCTGQDDSGIEVAHSDALEPKNFTVEAWLKIGGFPAGDKNRQWVVSKNKSEWHLGHYAIVIRGGSVGAYINTGGGEENSNQVWSDRGVLDAGTWHHLALTYNGNRMAVYVDGRQVASSRVKSKRVPGEGAFAIGKRPDGYSHLRGVVDEVRVFRDALPQKAIAYHHAHPGKVQSDARGALVRQWSFDQGTQMGQSYRKIMNRAGPME